MLSGILVLSIKEYLVFQLFLKICLVVNYKINIYQ